MGPRLRSSCRFSLMLAMIAWMLPLAGCESTPKPKHEIGTVEYDKIIDWQVLGRMQPEEARKYLGQTLTFNNLLSRGQRQSDDSRKNVCSEVFAATPVALEGIPINNGGIDGVAVYINFREEVIPWLEAEATDTFTTNVSVPKPLVVEEDICGKCKGMTEYDHLRKEFVSEQTTEECSLESRALHVTGKVVGIDKDNKNILIIPMGLAW